MIWIVVGVAVIIAIAVIILLNSSQQRGLESVDYPYQAIATLFTPAERSFYGVLKQAIANNAEVFGKVRVADVVTPKQGLSRSQWQTAFNKISAKHFDFLLCHRDDLAILCVIELNDRSHQSKKRQQRDEFLQQVCAAANLPLIQVPAQSSYAIHEIRALLSPYVSPD